MSQIWKSSQKLSLGGSVTYSFPPLKFLSAVLQILADQGLLILIAPVWFKQDRILDFFHLSCARSLFFISQTKSSFQIQGKYSSSQSREATSVRVASFRESSKVRGFSKCAARLLLRYIIYDSQLIIFGFWCSEMEDGRFQISLQ